MAEEEAAGSSGVKRIKYRGKEDEDDDLEVVPCRAQTKNAVASTSESEPEDSCELRRVNPNSPNSSSML